MSGWRSRARAAPARTIVGPWSPPIASSAMRTSPAIPSSDRIERVARTARRGATIAAPPCKATQETRVRLQPATVRFDGAERRAIAQMLEKMIDLERRPSEPCSQFSDCAQPLEAGAGAIARFLWRKSYAFPEGQRGSTIVESPARGPASPRIDEGPRLCRSPRAIP